MRVVFILLLAISFVVLGGPGTILKFIESQVFSHVGIGSSSLQEYSKLLEDIKTVIQKKYPHVSIDQTLKSYEPNAYKPLGDLLSTVKTLIERSNGTLNTKFNELYKDVNILPGLMYRYPATHCSQILQAAKTIKIPSTWYWINHDYDMSGSKVTIQAVCDMVTGGWMLIGQIGAKVQISGSHLVDNDYDESKLLSVTQNSNGAAVPNLPQPFETAFFALSRFSAYEDKWIIRVITSTSVIYVMPTAKCSVPNAFLDQCSLISVEKPLSEKLLAPSEVVFTFNIFKFAPLLSQKTIKTMYLGNI